MVDEAVSREAERSERQPESSSVVSGNEQQNQSGGADEGGDTDVQRQEEVKSEGEEDENEVLIAKAQGLIDKITANPENPSPIVLHALSSLLETQESR